FAVVVENKAFDVSVIPQAPPRHAIAVESSPAAYTTLAATWNDALLVVVSSSCASAEGSSQAALPASFSQGSATPSGPTRTANGSEASRRRAARAVAASPAAHHVGLCGGSPARWAALSKISR